MIGKGKPEVDSGSAKSAKSPPHFSLARGLTLMQIAFAFRRILEYRHRYALMLQNLINKLVLHWLPLILTKRAVSISAVSILSSVKKSVQIRRSVRLYVAKLMLGLEVP